MDLGITEQTLYTTDTDIQEMQSADLANDSLGDSVGDSTGDSTSESTVAQTIQTVFIVAVCIVGLVANSLAFLVVVKSSIIKSTTGVYLTCLAIFDNVALVLNLIYRFTNVVDLSDFLCKSIMSGTTSIMTITWHLIAWMTLDRCYLILTPHKPKLKRRVAFIVVTAGVSMLVLLYAVQLGIMFGLVEIQQGQGLGSEDSTEGNALTFENMSFYHVHNLTFSKIPLSEKNGTLAGEMASAAVCTVLPEYLDYFEMVYTPFDIAFSCMLTPITVIVGNLIIVIYLRKQSAVAPVGAQGMPKHDKRVTRMLVMASLFFLLCVLPSAIQFTLIPLVYGNIFEGINPENVLFQIFNTLLLINHSVNLFLYILSSGKFREETKNVLNSIFNVLFRW